MVVWDGPDSLGISFATNAKQGFPTVLVAYYETPFAGTQGVLCGDGTGLDVYLASNTDSGLVLYCHLITQCGCWVVYNRHGSCDSSCDLLVLFGLNDT